VAGHVVDEAARIQPNEFMADPEQTPRLRPAHVLASSLAAVTGAFLASRLGVYGTVIGVGVISLFSTIGTDIYVRSLDRTRQMAARSRIRTIELPGSNPAAETAELPRAVETAESPLVTADVSHRSETAGRASITGPAADDQPTVALGGVPAGADRALGETGTMVPVDGHVDADGEEREVAVDPVRRRWTPARVSLIVAGALVSFVLAFLVITGIESVSGSSLSGGGRTTLGELGGSGVSTDPGSDTDEVDAPGQPVPTPESDGPSQPPTDPPDGDDRDVPAPPAEELPDPEIPVEPETPSPTESPTTEPTEPPTDEDSGTLGIPADPGT
jgi:hypothetical protein